jgi:protein-L-isoaspartate(D-aspartate) O-methyltransferase
MPSPRRSSQRLRRELVKQLREKGVLRSSAVQAAFRTVERERFLVAAVAEQGLEAVYRDEAIVTKRDTRGMPLSSSSQPALMAKMLELLEARPGDRVLEIGTGTGYNAALLAHIVSEQGRVTTIDIDPQLARNARRALRDGGYRASVKVGDGRSGYSDGAPYDRIIVTACADELATDWIEQLHDGGRMIVPLRLDPDGASIQVIPVFHRTGERVRSVGLTWGGFMPLHDGDGGWRPPPSGLTASQSSNGRHTSLASLTGAGIGHLSASAARELLTALLSHTGRPRRRGLTDLTSRQPPMLLLYLLLAIPAARRVSFSTSARMGIGLIEGRDSLAIVSVRTPWRADEPASSRARWRLDAYGGDQAARRLEHLLDEWQNMQRRRQITLQATATPRDGKTGLAFTWTTTDPKE